MYAWEVNPPVAAGVVAGLARRDRRPDPVGRWYRTRWLTEEFFKCLKTGCAYEKRQLESLDTLLVALALLAPIAWQLLLLRHLARALPDAPARVALTARQIRVLRAVGGTLPQRPTTRDALRAVARLGGHSAEWGARLAARSRDASFAWKPAGQPPSKPEDVINHESAVSTRLEATETACTESGDPARSCGILSVRFVVSVAVTREDECAPALFKRHDVVRLRRNTRDLHAG